MHTNVSVHRKDPNPRQKQYLVTTPPPRPKKHNYCSMPKVISEVTAMLQDETLLKNVWTSHHSRLYLHQTLPAVISCHSYTLSAGITSQACVKKVTANFLLAYLTQILHPLLQVPINSSHSAFLRETDYHSETYDFSIHFNIVYRLDIIFTIIALMHLRVSQTVMWETGIKSNR